MAASMQVQWRVQHDIRGGGCAVHVAELRTCVGVQNLWCCRMVVSSLTRLKAALTAPVRVEHRTMRIKEEVVIRLCCGLIVVCAFKKCWLDTQFGYHDVTVGMVLFWMRWGQCIACVTFTG